MNTRRPPMADLMKNARAHRAAIVTLAALLLGSTALTVPREAYAQVQSGVVQRVLIQGNERIEAGTVLSYLPIQPGDTVDPSRIDVALKTLFRTDLFADVKIDLQPNGDLVADLNRQVGENRSRFDAFIALDKDALHHPCLDLGVSRSRQG